MTKLDQYGRRSVQNKKSTRNEYYAKMTMYEQVYFRSKVLNWPRLETEGNSEMAYSHDNFSVLAPHK